MVARLLPHEAPLFPSTLPTLQGTHGVQSLPRAGEDERRVCRNYLESCEERCHFSHLLFICVWVEFWVFVMIFLYSNPACLSAAFVAPVVWLRELLPAGYHAPSVCWTRPNLLSPKEALGSWRVSPAPALGSAASSRGVPLPFMEDGVRSQDPDTGCARRYGGITAVTRLRRQSWEVHVCALSCRHKQACDHSRVCPPLSTSR